jgi:hypothetical protein
MDKEKIEEINKTILEISEKLKDKCMVKARTWEALVYISFACSFMLWACGKSPYVHIPQKIRGFIDFCALIMALYPIIYGLYNVKYIEMAEHLNEELSYKMYVLLWNIKTLAEKDKLILKVPKNVYRIFTYTLREEIKREKIKLKKELN